MKTTIKILISLLSLYSPLFGEPKEASLEEQINALPQREEVTISLKGENDSIEEITLKKSPYVFQNMVSIVPNEEFWVSFEIKEKQLVNLKYSKTKIIDKPHLYFKFSQTDSKIMMLMVQNESDICVTYTAAMLLPDNNFYMTSIIPVMPQLFSAESWPHPIFQLILSDFKIFEPSEQDVAK